MPARKYDQYSSFFGGTAGVTGLGQGQGQAAQDYNHSGGLAAFQNSQPYLDFTKANPRYWEGANSVRNTEAYQDLAEEHFRSWNDALYKGTSKEGSGYWNTPVPGAASQPGAMPPSSGFTSGPTPTSTAQSGFQSVSPMPVATRGTFGPGSSRGSAPSLAGPPTASASPMTPPSANVASAPPGSPFKPPGANRPVGFHRVQRAPRHGLRTSFGAAGMR